MPLEDINESLNRLIDRVDGLAYSLMLESLRHFPNKQINQVWLDAFPDNKPN